ncbi:MAG: glycoside hydrolase family 125 protein [Acholeplasmataceae bacterium]|jgi:meiotically up-regulated gene 157 (Mug157) protein|nr:glycoside hydrolase family 125 protein [Acholeplasmataceae bacterium]
MEKYQNTYKWLNERLSKLSKWPKLQKIYQNTFLSTLETTTKSLDDGTSYVFTGDIPAMWLRDSSAQVRHYIKLCKIDQDMNQMIQGLIERQFMYINIDPYANAFNEYPDEKLGHIGDLPKIDPWVWERKFELDSLCYPLWILDIYFQETGNNLVFTETVKKGFQTILETIKIELNHKNKSYYWFIRPNAREDESPKNGGRGRDFNDKIDLIWSAFRPSDDVCIYNYFIPGNQFAVLALEILAKYLEDKELANEAKNLAQKINQAINQYGIVRHETYGEMFAYEIDGFGNYNLMDDANIPSLLALPYLNYLSIDNPIYQNTRRFILSKENPFYFEGKFAKGIGSPHTPDQYIWHIGLIAQALTTNNFEEKKLILKTLLNTHNNTYVMHEGFHANNPALFTREWFSWANSLFSHFIDENFAIIEELMAGIE